MDLKAIQKAIREAGFCGWLFYDFHNRDHMSYRILGLDEHKMTSRRWYYFVPAEGEPQKVVSMVEPGKLDSLPGKKNTYNSYETQHALLKSVLEHCKKVAMQYSPNNNIPYISLVDAGTVELIRSFGISVVSSADLVQIFEGLVTEEAAKSHFKAMELIDAIKNEAFELIGNKLLAQEKITEYMVQDFILDSYKKKGLVTDDSRPIVGVNEHAADPHFDPTPETTHQIKKGDLVLIDLWAKLTGEDSVFADITWMGYAGEKIPARIQEIWKVVIGARDAAIEFERMKFKRGEPCFGWEIDDASRNHIDKHGFGKFFVHRTGHSIGREIHGNAVHLDNLETKDERRVVPGILHSVEPGIYIYDEKIGVRSEVNVYVNSKEEVIVTGPLQKELIIIKC